MNIKFKQATAMSIILLTTLLLAVLSQTGNVANAQANEAIVIISATTGGTTTPTPGTYNYPEGTNIEITATPNTGYEFDYWVISGNFTPGHTQGSPVIITDPETGEVITGFPRPQVSGIDSLIVMSPTLNVTCGYGYTYQYTAVFSSTTPGATPVPTPTSNTAVAVVAASTGGTTVPEPGTYSFANGTTFTLVAMPDDGYAFHYWNIAGNFTPGHGQSVPREIMDPETGEIVATIPVPPVPTVLDSLIVTQPSLNITCGSGYTYEYVAVFTPVSDEPHGSPSPGVTTTPTTTQSPGTASPEATPTASPAPAGLGGLSTELIIVIVVVIIIIIIAIALLVMRRR